MSTSFDQPSKAKCEWVGVCPHEKKCDGKCIKTMEIEKHIRNLILAAATWKSLRDQTKFENPPAWTYRDFDAACEELASVVETVNRIENGEINMKGKEC
jgi:hypothetical protein